MANKEHLAILKQGVEAWNKWRFDNPDIVPDLVGSDLMCADLSGVDLRQAILIQAKLIGANLRGANLSGANLSTANLTQAILIGAALRGANLQHADLAQTKSVDADLSDADLTHANLVQAHLIEVNLNQAKLIDANFTQANLTGANLRGANITGTNFSGANLRNTILDKTTKKDSPSDLTIVSFERSLQSQMETMRKNLEEKIEQVKNSLNNEQIKQHVNDTISEKIDKIVSEDIVQKVGAETLKLSSDFSIKQDISEFIKDKYNNSSTRYGGYAEDSKNEALLYRNWGIGFCIAGIGVAMIVLGFILYGQYPDYKEWGKVFIGLPLTLTLEAIGLLLLTLSQKATERMRSFSIEQCNLDIQSAGYLSLVKTGDMKKITTAIEGLAKSERRYILKKDERTIEDSHNKSHLEFMKSVTDTLKPLLNNNNRQS